VEVVQAGVDRQIAGELRDYLGSEVRAVTAVVEAMNRQLRDLAKTAPAAAEEH